MNFEQAFIDELVKVGRYFLTDKEKSDLKRKLDDGGVSGFPFSKERIRRRLHKIYEVMTPAERLNVLKLHRNMSRMAALLPYVGAAAPVHAEWANARLARGKANIARATEGRPGSFVGRFPNLAMFTPIANRVAAWRSFSRGSLAGDEIAKLEKRVNKKRR